jgi:hypothetical protein
VLAAGVSLLAAVIFAADLMTPLGVAGGVPYIVCVLIAAWLGGRRFVLTAAIATSVLTLLGLALAPAGASPFPDRDKSPAIWGLIDITASMRRPAPSSLDVTLLPSRRGDLFVPVSPYSEPPGFHPHSR